MSRIFPMEEHTFLRSELKTIQREERYQTSSDRIVAVSEEMGRVLQMAGKVALSDLTTVLLQGESGTGKELIARAIHDRSKRENMPFITVNCAGFTENLSENELCGHEKGAFTDAKEAKKGLLEVAEGGTLFLDEIGDMSLNLQAKILRLVESRYFRRIGGLKEIKANVRIITATNKDLMILKDEGKFREDLFYRINVACIQIPPLRERPEDILPLTKYFVEKFNEDFHKDVQKISGGVEDFFMSYSWPGNVRELRNVVERAMIFIEKDTLEVKHLPIEIQTQAPKPGKMIEGIRIAPEGISLEKVEETLVKQALEISNGNQTRAATLLDISRDALRSRMKKFSLLPGQDCH
jgi:transcriptional regulator with PAS, ATPase and Fis domain